MLKCVNWLVYFGLVQERSEKMVQKSSEDEICTSFRLSIAMPLSMNNACMVTQDGDLDKMDRSRIINIQII